MIECNSKQMNAHELQKLTRSVNSLDIQFKFNQRNVKQNAIGQKDDDVPAEFRNPLLLKYKKTHVDYYVVLAGKKPPEGDKYTLFKKWAEDNGIIWPKVEWPIWFDNDYMGAKAKEDIGYREAFAMIPWKIILSCKDTLEHPILGPICKKHP